MLVMLVLRAHNLTSIKFMLVAVMRGSSRNAETSIKKLCRMLSVVISYA